MMKPSRITLLSNVAMAVGFVLLLIGVVMIGDDSSTDARVQVVAKHSLLAPAAVFWAGVALFVGGCFVRAWRF